MLTPRAVAAAPMRMSSSMQGLAECASLSAPAPSPSRNVTLPRCARSR